jgi:FkbM family methyltransferase
MAFTTYAQNFEDVLLWRAFKDEVNGFYIDVGAWDPDADSVTRAFSERGWRGINIEPVPAAFRKLAASRPADVNLQVAVGERESDAILYEVADTGLSTLVRDQAEKHAAAGFSIRPQPIRIVTLAEICERHAVATIHFLKLDCEGSERDVLLGADFVRFRPQVVLVEATAPNSQEPTHAEWEDVLLGQGYRFAWFDGLNRFYVAQEHEARIAPLLACPPNVFDGFVYPVPPMAPAPPPTVTDPLVLATPDMIDIEQRILLATRCRDCDDVPKVADAGGVQVLPDGTRVQIMHNGLRVVADGYCGEWMTRLIGLCHGHHEPQEERIFHQLAHLLPEDATMIELGSNWGYYSAWFLKDRPDRRAILVEPDPANRAVGERNLALNGLTATVLEGTVGARACPASLFETERSGLRSIPCFSVPSLLADQDMAAVDLLHCDTQGAELDVLTGSLDLFAAGRIGWIMLSTHVHQISGDALTHQRCLALLREQGATIEVEHNPYESFSGDGLIVARFRPAPEGWEPVSISYAREEEALFREPVYDLAAQAQIGATERMRHVVADSFRALLLREPEPAVVASYADLIIRTGSATALLQDLLGSPEFASKLPVLRERYGMIEPPLSFVAGDAAGVLAR